MQLIVQHSFRLSQMKRRLIISLSLLIKSTARLSSITRTIHGSISQEHFQYMALSMIRILVFHTQLDTEMEVQRLSITIELLLISILREFSWAMKELQPLLLPSSPWVDHMLITAIGLISLPSITLEDSFKEQPLLKIWLLEALLLAMLTPLSRLLQLYFSKMFMATVQWEMCIQMELSLFSDSMVLSTSSKDMKEHLLRSLLIAEQHLVSVLMLMESLQL